MHRAAALRSVRAVPRIPRAVIWAVALLVLLGTTFLWFRDSSFVSADHVTVTGLSGPEATRVAGLLEETAHDMTTLHVRESALRAVVEPYPVVKGLKVSTDFPHGMHITVIENAPVAMVVADGTRTAVSADGQLLRGAQPRVLAAVPIDVTPVGDRVTDRAVLKAIAAIAAAPPALRARVQRATTTREHGLVLDLRDGPDLRFGGNDRLAAKWAAAAAVLADKSSAGATYVDLRYPERPAAGGLVDPATQVAPDAANAAGPSTATPAGAATPTPAATNAP